MRQKRSHRKRNTNPKAIRMLDRQGKQDDMEHRADHKQGRNKKGVQFPVAAPLPIAFPHLGQK